MEIVTARWANIRRMLILCVAVGLVVHVAAQSPPELIIRNGLVVTADARSEADVRIRNGTIAEIGRNLAPAAGAREIDARGMTQADLAARAPEVVCNSASLVLRAGQQRADIGRQFRLHGARWLAEVIFATGAHAIAGALVVIAGFAHSGWRQFRG